jgi:hypothetical protein
MIDRMIDRSFDPIMINRTNSLNRIDRSFDPITINRTNSL